MSAKAIKRIGDWLERIDIKAINRTGATLAKGQFAMIDILDTEAETVGTSPGDTDGIWATLTACTQAGVDAGFPVVMALESVADNAKGNFLMRGYTEDAAFLDDDVSTTDIDKGDALAILVSESAVALQASAATTQRWLGIALEDTAAATDASATQIDASSHRRKAYFDGTPGNVTFD
jgi:hypothetical protein